MATHAPHFARASALPLSAVLASIPSYPRPVIERLVARLIDTLDEQDAPITDMEDDDPLEDSDPDEDEGDREPDCPEGRLSYLAVRCRRPSDTFIQWQGRTMRCVSL